MASMIAIRSCLSYFTMYCDVWYAGVEDWSLRDMDVIIILLVTNYNNLLTFK